MRRRQALLGTTAVLSGVSGCLGLSTSDSSLREVNVELLNPTEQARTFHLALEIEAGMLDWESHHIDAGADEEVTITLNGEVSLVALHGAVNEFVGSVNNIDPDGPGSEYCLQFQFYYTQSMDEDPQISQVADIEC